MCAFNASLKIIEKTPYIILNTVTTANNVDEDNAVDNVLYKRFVCWLDGFVTRVAQDIISYLYT